MIRHITGADNVENGGVLDPSQVRHGVITGMKISDVAGLIDPFTHLNLDHADHLMYKVVVAERLEEGAAVLMDEGRFMTALVHPAAYHHYGAVDMVARRVQWKEVFQK